MNLLNIDSIKSFVRWLLSSLGYAHLAFVSTLLEGIMLINHKSHLAAGNQTRIEIEL